MLYVTKLDHPEYSDRYNRYDGYNHPVILHNGQWHFGRFPSMEKLKEFMDFAGLELGELTEEKSMGRCGMFRSWRVDGMIEEHGFGDINVIPENAKPFTGLSNGSLVTCYLLKDSDILKIYRPNPNYKDVYKPLSISEHRTFCRENGYV